MLGYIEFEKRKGGLKVIMLQEEDIRKNWDSSKPLVSIFCLAYNHEKYIAQCLDGFLMQETNFPFEVIVHDDASTDATATIIREYELKYPNIVKPIYETENQFSKNKNETGILPIINEKIQGKYVAMSEGDDYWIDSAKLQMQFDAMENNPNCPIAFNRVKFVDAEQNDIGYIAPPEIKNKNNLLCLDDYINTEYRDGKWTVHTSSFFVRTPIWKDYCIKREKEYSVFPYGDMAIVIYSLLLGPAYLVPRVMGCYRKFSGGYNSFVVQNDQFAISQENKLISALLFVDEITNGTYSEQIGFRIFRSKMEIAVRAKDNKLYLKLLKERNTRKAYGTLGYKKYLIPIWFFVRLNAPWMEQIINRIRYHGIKKCEQ